MVRAVQLLVLALGLFVPALVCAAADMGVAVSPLMTRDGDFVAVDSIFEGGSHRFNLGPAVHLTNSALPAPTAYGGQVGWQYQFRSHGTLRPYFHPEYSLFFLRPGTVHTIRWQYGVEVPLSRSWWVGQSLGMGLVREELREYRAWGIDGIFRISGGVRF